VEEQRKGKACGSKVTGCGHRGVVGGQHSNSVLESNGPIIAMTQKSTVLNIWYELALQFSAHKFLPRSPPPSPKVNLLHVYVMQ